jgi:GDPmannose 4,6-dehydratase
MRKRAMITGAAGQDGSYLAELLDADGDEVVGVVRDPARARAALPGSVALDTVDLLDVRAIAAALARHRPDEVYNLAAHSSGERMFEDPLAVGDFTGLTVTRLLEAIRAVDARIRLVQASSSEMFGDVDAAPQSEATRFQPRTPYGVAKLGGHHLIRIYRKRYGLHASSAILYNHESPRRGPGFVTRKVTLAAARIALGHDHELRLGNLDARRDWGFAGDTVRALRAMARADVADDYVVATGVTHSVRELCALAFGHVGLDYRRHVVEDPALVRPDEPVEIVGDAGKLRAALGWRPAVTFEELVRTMVDADRDRLAAAPKELRCSPE